MKVLLVGFGSIGKRHFEILSGLSEVESIDVVTKQRINNKDGITFKALDLVKELSDYDYFVIATETVKHYQQLEYISSKVTEKKILVEKPLFDKCYQHVIECDSKVFTAYNLRFHPVLKQVKELIKNEQVYSVNAICGQYLPTWRPEQDYRQSYSADINQGGGVLRDLSHELDYLIWLFGDIKTIDSINAKISDLEISSDDIFTAIAVTTKGVIVNVTVDYISKSPMRRLLIHTKNSTIEADVINCEIAVYDKQSNKQQIDIVKVDRNYSYTKMHQAIISEASTTACSYEAGERVVNLIDSVEFKVL